MPELALKVNGISKLYQLNRSNQDRFREGVIRYGRTLFNRNQNTVDNGSLWALKDVSFDLEKGEALGVFGSNGSGKSTLLKILSEVTQPTEGSVEIYGKVASVLDVGMGFHQDLTGRENVFFCGSVFGMSRMELSKNMDQIVDFSGIGEFIDSPVKHYSSGMYMRLAFALVSHISADILLFDEVFSVGDAAFKHKTLKKMRALAKEGKTIIIVTHNLGEITNICNRAIIMEHGKIKASGSPDELIADYVAETFELTQQESTSKLADEAQEQKRTANNVKIWDNLSEAPGNERARIVKFQVFGHKKDPSEDIYMEDGIDVEVSCKELIANSNCDVGFTLYDHAGNNVFAATTVISANAAGVKIDGDFTATCHIPPNTLNAGVFTMNVFLVENEKEIFRSMPGVVIFRVLMNESELNKPWSRSFPGPLRPLLDWEIVKTKNKAN